MTLNNKNEKMTKVRALVCCHAPISVKPEGDGRCQSGNPRAHGNLTVAYVPRVGILIGH